MFPKSMFSSPCFAWRGNSRYCLPLNRWSLSRECESRACRHLAPYFTMCAGALGIIHGYW